MDGPGAVEDRKVDKEDDSTQNEEKTDETDTDFGSDTYLSVEEDFISSGDEMEDSSDHSETKSEGKSVEVSSGYASSSDEDKVQTSDVSQVQKVETISDLDLKVMKQIAEKYNLFNLPEDLQEIMIHGVTKGLPNDYNVPIDKKPEWLDMEKFKRGQAFARKYFCGVNLSEMASLFILFGLPDGLETLIFSNNSSTPFAAFQRYISTVVRVASWYDHDIWSEGNPGYQNIKVVRAMHLNVAKRMSVMPFEELRNKVTLTGSKSKPPIWNSEVRETLQDDFKAGCPFGGQSKHNTIERSVFVTQMEMSVTQFGFVGLMVTFPEKFGAGDASREELEAFLHTWKGICYLLGSEDRYNFCNGTLDEVVQRCRAIIEHWVKPSFQTLTRDWEHMSRCLVEGMGYVLSTDKQVMSFEVSMMHLCWVLEIPAPRLYAALSWSQRFHFFMIKFLMTKAVRIPGVLAFFNWSMRRFIARAASLPSEELDKLRNRKYDYQVEKRVKDQNPIRKQKSSRGSLLLLLSLARLLI